VTLVDIEPGLVGWEVGGELVASVRAERRGSELALHSLTSATDDDGRALLDAIAGVATATTLSLDGAELRAIAPVPAPPQAVAAVTLGALEAAIRAAWGVDTSDEPEDWSPDNPATGQCSVTARVVRDYLGGDILVAGVVRDGARVNRHAWNRLPSGLTIDLTREQFQNGETLEAPSVAERLLTDRHPERYELLAARVRDALGI
jgi:hypothetical protein